MREVCAHCDEQSQDVGGDAPLAAPATREAAFHDRARRVWSVNYRITVATTTLPLLTRQGPDHPVWRVVGHGEDRRPLYALPTPR